MVRWKTVLAALLALVYTLASGYCLLEKANLVPEIDCCPETAADSREGNAPCEGYGCCAIEYAVYSNRDSGIADIMAPPSELVFPIILFLVERPAEVPITQLERSPPHISKSWQFFSRTALPPRAPSLAS